MLTGFGSLPQGIRQALIIVVMQCDFVVSFTFEEFLMKSRHVTNLYQHEERVSVAWDGCHDTLVQLFECWSHEHRFVVVFGSSR